MEGRQIPLQARVPVQRQNKRVKGNPQAQPQKEQEKAVQNPRKVERENEKQGVSQDPKALEFNGKHQKTEPVVKMKPSVEVSAPEEAESGPTNLRGNDDKKLARPVAEKPLKAQAPNKPKTPREILNGVKTKPSGSLACSQEDREADKNDSGSDDSYSAHKQQRARCSLPRVRGNFHLARASMMSRVPRFPALQQRFDNLKLTGGNHRGFRVGSPRPPVWNSRSWAPGPGHSRFGFGNVQRPLPFKPGLNSPRLNTWSRMKPTPPAVPKEETWGLFKQPAIFPGSNYTVPEVTYASKVKQNLYKVPRSFISPRLATSESLPLLPSSSALVGSPIVAPGQRQVPGASLRPVNPLGPDNKPEQNMLPYGGQDLPMDICLMKWPIPNLKSAMPQMGPSCPSLEQRFFIRAPVLTTIPEDLMPNTRPSQMEAQKLREIVKNKWGLSFISELDTEPESTQEMASEAEVGPPPLPGKYPIPSPLASQGPAGPPAGAEHLRRPQVYDVTKWLNPQGLGGIVKPAILKKESDEAFIPLPSLRDELQKADHRSTGSFMLLRNENQSDSSEPFTLSLDPILKEAEERGEWEPFNFRAAVEYHMAEMKSIWDLQKKDPKKVIIYDESLDI
ncbi:nuclear fragile X mental retardation-interacting protein 2-like [Gracilinanus agilis]|uniref:nuclear fragile X mental retardation-interacting protein 2-like n=1 Tax=Gracilinanus agilis TaxID=191870 RepID=UPI001CFE3F8D|nr:nuclear fragile X mental retardation-interacting protein 2-like [Gracilinanus agilis]